VFAIDTRILGERSPVWDSFESMRRHHGQFLSMDFQSIIKLVQAFDVQQAGSILSSLHQAMLARAQRYADTLALQPDVSHSVERSAWQRANEALLEEELHSLCSVLESVCQYRERGFAREAFVATPYGAAFQLALPRLQVSLEAAASKGWRHPGWDTTVFGYIAKTCRDREFFSSGAIPAEAIKECRIVNAAGNIDDAIQNPCWGGPRN
jgi:hypothetical protein